MTVPESELWTFQFSDNLNFDMHDVANVIGGWEWFASFGNLLTDSDNMKCVTQVIAIIVH